MAIEGRCYCGAVRYRAEGDPLFKGQCYCRECQYISGGGPNLVMGVSTDGFSITQGETRTFRRSDLEKPASREFCPECGTHLLTRAPVMNAVMLKVGTLDDPSVFGGAQMAIYLCDKQAFHQVPEGIPTFERLPG